MSVEKIVGATVGTPINPEKIQPNLPKIGENVWDANTGDYIDSGVCAVGEHGFSPIVCISKNEVEGVTTISVEDAYNITGALIYDGKDGKDGEDGKEGYTPQKGTDYWTESDKAEIKAYVDEVILGGAW